MDATLVLTRRDVVDLLELDDCIDVVEEAFALHAAGRIPAPGVLATHVDDGAFHIKTCSISRGGRTYFVAKTNANFPQNPKRFALPTIQGVIALFDAERGSVLALLESAELTALRTAAATAVAARHLSRAESATVTICGCGVQGREHLRAIVRVRPVRTVLLCDVDRQRAMALAERASAELSIDVHVVSDMRAAAQASDICITTTSAREPVLHYGDVRPGTFVAAVGADNPAKQEIEPRLLAESVVVADILEQCAAIGDLHHAITAGAMRREDVYSELGEIVIGRKPAPRAEAGVVIFDSTGAALQDVAVAGLVYERALLRDRGMQVELAG